MIGECEKRRDGSAAREDLPGIKVCLENLKPVVALSLRGLCPALESRELEQMAPAPVRDCVSQESPAVRAEKALDDPDHAVLWHATGDGLHERVAEPHERNVVGS